MNRFERELAAHQGTLNGKRWHVRRRKDARRIEISERVTGSDGVTTLHSRFNPITYQFAHLDAAAGNRFHAAALPRYCADQRATLIRRAREAIARSRESRLDTADTDGSTRRAA